MEGEGRGPGIKPAENWHFGNWAGKESDEEYLGRCKKIQEAVEPPKGKEQRNFEK